MDNTKEKKPFWIRWVTIGITVIALAFTAIILFTGSIQYTIQEETLSISASFSQDFSIPLKEIQSVTYPYVLDPGRKVQGLDGFRLYAGHFRNDQLSDYQLYVYLSCKESILLQTSQGPLVCNEETSEKTKKLYERLRN